MVKSTGKGTGEGPTTKNGRDAKAGEFIPVREVIHRPSITVMEAIGRPMKKRK